MSDPDDDPVAAEYVLGTLDDVELAAFEARRRADPSLELAIEAWERRFGPLCEAAPEIAPPPHLYPALIARLFGPTNTREVAALSDFRDLKRSLWRWRSATAACAALAASLLTWIALAPASKQDQKFVAVLQKDAGSPAVLLDVDIGARKLTIRPVSAEEPANKSYELWLISPSVGAPRSLGTLAPRGITLASLTPYDPATITGATYAVTLEPAGGSPTGAPSGPPVLTGRLTPSP